MNTRLTVLQGLDQFEGRHAGRFCVQTQVDGRYVGTLAVGNHFQDRVPQAGTRSRQFFHEREPVLSTLLRVLGDEALERGEQTDDLLLAHFAGPADAVLGSAGERIPVDQRGRRPPQLRQHIQVQLLQGSGGDQVAPAAENAGTLGTADRLAAAEGHQVGAGGDEAL